MKKFSLIFIIFLMSYFTELLAFSPITPRAETLSEQCGASLTIGPPLSLEQLKGQIYLYDEALKEFGASSPEQAARLWANGYKHRNGVMQYSVMCRKLKKQWLKDQGAPNNAFWIIGGSSPWLHDYAILENKKINDSSYIIKLKLNWMTSVDKSFQEETLSIVSENGKWCIAQVK